MGFLQRQLPERLRRWLEGTRFELWAALIGVLLCLPSLGAGLQTEDYFHRDFVETGVSAQDFFAYLESDEGGHRTLRDRGELPWIADDGLKSSFWRPLAALTHLVDYDAWPDAPWLAHAQSLLWYGLLIIAVGCLYRRLATPLWLAAIATFFYAVDDAHGQPVGWLANRSALMATFFGVMALVCHVGWRRRSSALLGFLSPVLLGLGLLSAEFALGIVGYFVAFALFLDRARPLKRLASLVPMAVVCALWWIAYRALGHGVEYSGLHVDPGAHPLAALVVAAWRAPALLTAALALPPSDAWNYLDASARTFWLFGAAVFLVFVLVVFIPIFRRRADARFWGLGTLLSLGPIATTFPQDRLLLFVGIGTFGLIAVLWRELFVRSSPENEPENEPEDEPEDGPASTLAVWRSAAVVLLAFWIVVHGVVSPLLLPMRSLHMATLGARIAQAQDELFPRELNPNRIAMVVNSPSFYLPSVAGSMSAAQGRPFRRFRVLYGGDGEATIERVDDHSLRITSPRGFGTNPHDQAFRAPFHPMQVGDVAQVRDLSARVLSVTDEGYPESVLFTFASPLEAPIFEFLEWRDGAFSPFSLPSPGETLKVSATEAFP